MATTITVQLDMLRAACIRDTHSDQLAAVFVVYVDNHPVGTVTGCLAADMRPGDFLSFGDFSPDNAGTWSVSVALDESSPAAELGFLLLVHNIRGLDMALVRRYLAKASFILSTVAANALFPDQAASLATSISETGMIGEALDSDIVDQMFKMPAESAGPVFAYHAPNRAMIDILTTAETGDNLIAHADTEDVWRLMQGPIPSDPLTTPEPDQQVPGYLLNVSFIVDAARHEEAGGAILTRGLIPLTDTSPDDWTGKRRNRPIAEYSTAEQLPSIFCTIAPSLTEPGTLAVQVEEKLQGSDEIIFSKSYDGIVPATGNVIPFGGDILARHRSGRLMPRQRPYMMSAEENEGWAIAGTGSAFATGKQQAAPAAAETSGSLARPSMDIGTMPSVHATPSIHAAPRGAVGKASHLIEAVDWIILDDAKMTLALYSARQNNVILGRAIRYMRPTDLLWTRVDTMLFSDERSH